MQDLNLSEKSPVYEESTQYKHWRFSPEQLWDIRSKSTTEATNRVKRNIQEETNTLQDQKTPPEKFLTAKEEFTLCRFYEKQLQVMSKHCKFADMVMATAVIYMKRFFLRNTVMDYHPKDVFLTCLFLATKSESERVSIEDFGKNLRLPSTENVLKLEFAVSQGLKFHYYVHHPYRPAYGFFLDMQTGSIDMKLLKETYKKVNAAIADILLTDLPLIYQPPQLALAAFIIAGKENGFDRQVKHYIKERFTESKGADMLIMMEHIIALLKAVDPISQEEAKKIDYKLKLCKNPAMDPDSALYKKRLADKHDGEQAKKKSKLEEHSATDSSSDGSESSSE